jgi:hypothetical protein
MAAHATTHAAIAGLQSDFVVPNMDLLRTLQGHMPEKIQVRDPKTGAPLFDEAQQPIYVTEAEAKKRQLQRYVRLMQNNISSMGDACKKEKEDKQKAVADAKEELLRKRDEVLQRELLLLEKKKEACDIDGLGPDALEEKLISEKRANRMIERTMAKRLVELRAAEAPAPKRRRGGNSSAAAATGDAIDEECDDAASSAAASSAAPASTPAPALTPAPASASASSAAAAAAPKSKARAKAKSAPMVACEGMTQGGTVQCKRKVPAGTRFCCKHKVDAPVITPGQQFFCGYKNCTAVTSEQGVLCAKCQSLAEDGSVESAVCEHCGDKPAADDSKYCKGCIEVLEKELGLADEDDEEKHADGVGGSAEPSTAPGISVEPPSAAPEVSVEQGAGGDGAAKAAAAAPLPPVVCVYCKKKPATRESLCDWCRSTRVEYARRQAAMKEAEKGALVYFHDELEQCKRCNVASRKFCEAHGPKIYSYAVGVVDGAGGATPAAPGVSVEPAPTASAADASDESSHNATSAAVEHVLCHRCGKKPVADDCSDYCEDCLAKLDVA